MARLRKRGGCGTRSARENIFIKVPGTKPGIPAIRQLLAEGLNINITLLFSQQVYEEVVEAYLSALEDRAAAGKPIDRIASVASFFVSRIDTAVDKLLDEAAARAASEAERTEPAKPARQGRGRQRQARLSALAKALFRSRAGSG